MKKNRKETQENTVIDYILVEKTLRVRQSEQERIVFRKGKRVAYSNCQQPAEPVEIIRKIISWVNA